MILISLPSWCVHENMLAVVYTWLYEKNLWIENQKNTCFESVSVCVCLYVLMGPLIKTLGICYLSALIDRLGEWQLSVWVCLCVCVDFAFHALCFMSCYFTCNTVVGGILTLHSFSFACTQSHHFFKKKKKTKVWMFFSCILIKNTSQSPRTFPQTKGGWSVGQIFVVMCHMHSQTHRIISNKLIMFMGISRLVCVTESHCASSF